MQVSDLEAAFSPRVTLLAGAAGIDATVRWVHATDLPIRRPICAGASWC